MRFLSLLFVMACVCLYNTWSVSAESIMTDDPLLKDPDLLASLEIFMGMSPKEREETIKDLMSSVKTKEQKKEMKDLLDKLSAMDVEQLQNSPTGVTSSIKQMIQDDEIAKAKHNARQMLDDKNLVDSWRFFLDNEAQILEATIQGGQLTTEQIATFKTDKDAWKKQLRVIWEDINAKEL